MKKHCRIWSAVTTLVAFVFWLMLQDAVASALLAVMLMIVLMPCVYLIYWLSTIAQIRTIAGNSFVAVGVTVVSTLALEGMGFSAAENAAGTGMTVVFSLFASVRGSGQV